MRTIKFFNSSLAIDDFKNIESTFHVEIKTAKNPGGYNTARKHLVFAGKACYKQAIKLVPTKNGLSVQYSIERDSDSLLRRMGFLNIQDFCVAYATDSKTGKTRPRIIKEFTEEFLTLDFSACTDTLALLLDAAKHIVLLKNNTKIATYIPNVLSNGKMGYVPIEGYEDPRKEIPEEKMNLYLQKGIAIKYYTFMASTSQQRHGCIEMIKE